MNRKDIETIIEELDDEMAPIVVCGQAPVNKFQIKEILLQPKFCVTENGSLIPISSCNTVKTNTPNSLQDGRHGTVQPFASHG